MTATEGSSTPGPRKGIAKWFEDIRFGVEKKIKDTSSIRKIKSFDVKTTAAPKLLGDNKSHPPDAVQDAAFETDTVPPASYWDASYWVSNVKRKRNSSSSSSYGDINSTFSRSSAGSLGAHSIGSNRSLSLSTPFPYPMDIPPLPPKNPSPTSQPNSTSAVAVPQDRDEEGPIYTDRKARKVRKKYLIRPRRLGGASSKRLSAKAAKHSTQSSSPPFQRRNTDKVSDSHGYPSTHPLLAAVNAHGTTSNIPSVSHASIENKRSSDVPEIDQISARIRSLEEQKRLQEQEALRLKEELELARSALKNLQLSNSTSRQQNNTEPDIPILRFLSLEEEKREAKVKSPTYTLPPSIISPTSDPAFFFDNSRPRVQPRTSQERTFASNLDDRYMSWL